MQREILKKCHSPASARACGTSYPFKLSKTGVYNKTTRKMQMNLHLTTVCEFCPVGITAEKAKIHLLPHDFFLPQHFLYFLPLPHGQGSFG